MKPRISNSVIQALLVLLLTPAAGVSATTPASDSVHFCVPFDYEQWRREHPLPAGKWAADQNVGEPRTVRMIYFLPNDRPFRHVVVDSIKVRIQQVQRFFLEQMEANGYGRRALRIETDVQGEPLVYRMNGLHPDSHYLDNTHVVYDEIDLVYDLRRNIYVDVVDNSIDAIGTGGGRRAGGTGGRRGKSGGSALVPGSLNFETVAHELGHACGLFHDFHDGSYIMSYGPGRRRLSACHAGFLSVHPYFNPNSPVEFEHKVNMPTIELLSPRAYPTGARRVSIHVKANDSDGLFQVLLFGRTLPPHFAAGSLEAKACRGLDGQRETVIEFGYDGMIPSALSSSLSEPVAHPVSLAAIDRKGNVRYTSLVLAETSPYQIATLEVHSSVVNSVVFSPKAPVLATGSWDSTITIWQTETSTPIAYLTGHQSGVSSVAFSSDGAILASGSWDSTIRVWNLSTSAEIGRLTGHAKGVRSVAFPASDTNNLASGSDDGTVILWDLATQEPIFTLEGHAAGVRSVAFSPDGAILASGSLDGTVILWDVAAGEQTATLEGHTSGISSVAFSPDGARLATGSWDDKIILWDVETRKQMSTLEGHSGNVYSVAFAAGGALVATGGRDGTVILWDVLTGESITTFGYPAEVLSVSFSAGGELLAAGGRDGGVGLWDVSTWSGPRPFALEIISGDGQQGVPGSALARPLVVEVRDQYGDPLPEASVTFRVTAGEGRLSGRFTVEHATTDARGQARLTLTLGHDAGPNTVGVFLGERQLATFNAEGIGAAVAELGGDYRTWHLPSAATVRLGKGAMGEGDRAVALSPDGRCQAVASGIGVWLYETATSRALALLKTDSRVHSVAFSTDGAVAAGLDDGRVALLDVETGTIINTLRHADWGRVTAVVFSPDGKSLVSGSWDQVIKLWDVETGQETGKWDVPREDNTVWPHSVDFSPDGTRLASGFQDGTVRLWSVANKNEVAVLEGHTDRVASVSFSPDGAFLASAGGRREPVVRLWDTATQAEVAALRGHRGTVNSVSFSWPDGATLASGSSDNTVRLWDVATRALIDILEDHTGSVQSVTFSRDGATLVSGGMDGRVLLRDLETGNAASVSGHGYLSSMALTGDGVTVALGYNDGTVRLMDAVTHAEVAALRGHGGQVYSVAFSPDGALLASGSLDRTVRLWDVAKQTEVSTLQGHAGRVTSVSFSPNGALLASAGGWGDATVRLWDVKTGEPMGILEGHEGEVRSVAFSPDGALLASGGSSDDKTVKLWDVAARERIASLGSHTSAVRAVVFSPDGRTLASGSSDGTVRLWNVATRAHFASLNNRSPVYSLAFSSDGAMLASGSWHGTVRLWDTKTREQIATLEGHTGEVHSVAFSDDNATLATGASDGTLLLWDVEQRLAPTIPDPDFDGDGTVGFADFVQFAAKFGLSQGDDGFDARFDLDGNGAVGFSDFVIFAGAFGKS